MLVCRQRHRVVDPCGSLRAARRRRNVRLCGDCLTAKLTANRSDDGDTRRTSANTSSLVADVGGCVRLVDVVGRSWEPMLYPLSYEGSRDQGQRRVQRTCEMELSFSRRDHA
jgi:hypothetical protein